MTVLHSGDPTFNLAMLWTAVLVVLAINLMRSWPVERRPDHDAVIEVDEEGGDGAGAEGRPGARADVPGGIAGEEGGEHQEGAPEESSLEAHRQAA